MGNSCSPGCRLWCLYGVFCAFIFPLDVLDGIWDLIESVSEGFLTYSYSVITFDEAIYCKANEIQWQRTDEFSDTILRLGGFHTVLNFMAVLGKHYEDSRLEDLLIESGLYGSNTVKHIVEGKVYSKGIRAMKQVMEALSRVRFSALAEYLGPQSQLENYIDNISTFHKAFVQSDLEIWTDKLQKIAKESEVAFHFMKQFQDHIESVSDTAAF